MSDTLIHLRKLVGMANAWALKSLPGWCNETHYDLLARYGAVYSNEKGRVSACSMTVPQLSAVLGDYERRGWVRKQQFGGKKTVPPRIALIVRLWGKLGMSGKLSNPTRPALLAFCTRQLGRDIENLDALSVAECQRIAEALKCWLAR